MAVAALVALVALGAGLITAPVVVHMFDRAPKGATMIRSFKPYMSSKRLDAYRRDIAQIRAGVREADTRLAVTLEGEGPAARARFEHGHSEFADFARAWGVIDTDMSNLLTTISNNVDNYNAVAALPDFRRFPWFFIIPGTLLVVLGAVGLLRPQWWPGVRFAVVVLGVGLIAAPAAFQMFTRAPKGAEMMQAFRAIETRHKVETIQGYFGTIAAGQGSIRLQLVPELRRTGLSNAELAARYPAVTTLDRRWVPILNELTPMIGAMSDNVSHYAAVAALPDFRLFPWFFVIPGLLAAGLALVATPVPRSRTSP